MLSTRQAWLFAMSFAVVLASLAPAEDVLRRDGDGEPLPFGVRARLGSTRFRVGDATNCLAISPDGTMLASADGSSVRFWDQTSGKERRTVGLPVLSLFHIAISPDGKYFAAIGDQQPSMSRPIGATDDHSVFVGEVMGGKVRQAFRGEFASAVFSADSKWLLAHGGAQERPVRMWDIANGKEVRQFPAVLSFALSPDGKTLAGGDEKGFIHLWDTKSGVENKQLKGHGSPVRALAFSPDGRTLASGSGALYNPFVIGNEKPKKPDNSVRLWDVASGKERVAPRRHTARITGLRFAPDGQSLASADESHALYLWDAATGRLRQLFPGDPEREDAFVFSPDGKYLFIRASRHRSESGQVLTQWDIAAGKETHVWKSNGRWLGQFLIAPDGKTLFALDGTIRAWDIRTGAEQVRDRDHHGSIRAMQFSREGKFLATVDDRFDLRVWDVVRAAPLPELAAERVLRCAFTPDGRQFITITSDAMVQVREVPSGRSVRRFRAGSAETIRVWAAFTHWWNDQPDLWDAPRACCVFDSACRILAVVQEDQCIHLWDVQRGEERDRLQGHRGTIGELVFSADGKWLFTAGEDRTIRWWDVAKGTEIQCYHDDGAGASCFSLRADGRRLAWAAGERIHLFDLAARKEIRQCKGHAGGTVRVLFGRGDALLASTGQDQIIRCWDARTGEELRSIPMKDDQKDLALLTSPGGRLFAHLSMDGKNSEYALRDVLTGGEVCRTRTYGGEHFALALDGNTAVLNRAKWRRIEMAGVDKEPPDKSLPYRSPYPPPVRAADELSFVELTSGGVIADVSSGHRGGVRCLAFSPDGQTLATGGADTTALLWDWQRLAGLSREVAPASTDRNIDSAWTDLAAADARKAYRAIGTLTASGDRVVSVLRERLRSAADTDRQRWRKWIAALDDSNFTVREKATRDLSQLGVEAELFLRRSAAAKVPLETRRRLEQALASEAMKRPSGESLRRIRATQVLEAIATPAARELLEAWSRGDADAWLTQEAQSALRRLQARPAP